MTSSTLTDTERHDRSTHRIEELEHVAVRFAGDSGDGMQLVGTQFTNASAVFGNEVSTFPDFPSEIRAPAGTVAGVSGFQVHFGAEDVRTPGDVVDTLLAMNPAALKVNRKDLREGGLLIVNSDEFTEQNLKRAKYEQNPLADDSLRNYRVYPVPITQLTLEAVKESGLGPRESLRCKNFLALGIVCWIFDRDLTPTLNWINKKFGKIPAVAQANTLALRAGYHYGETAEFFPVQYRVRRAKLRPGRYRNMTGNQATAMGLVAAAKLAQKPLFYGSYPITPASEILHDLAAHKHFDVRTFQAEDEIAAMCATIGAAFSGAVAATGTSGPGVALKQEAIGLAVMTELPCVIVNVQRGGPSTGLPTKTEQADLFQALFGRNGECPLPVLSAGSASDCFWKVIEAVRIAVKYMTPVMLLTDGFIANGAEPFRIPDVSELPKIPISHPSDPSTYQPYQRDALGARPWAVPGTKGLEHRVGGLEKADVTGHVSHDPDNHQRMVELRAQKVANVVADVPPAELIGADSGDLLVVSWGGTRGSVQLAVEQAAREGYSVGGVHLDWINPLPANLGALLKQFKQVLVCELNAGQLCWVLRARYLVDARPFGKTKGKPFMISEIYDAIVNRLGAAQ
jgi:2-oxoglutarate/2-oxoacid ferredoxin oxidoreductase subunit alpha